MNKRIFVFIVLLAVAVAAMPAVDFGENPALRNALAPLAVILLVPLAKRLFSWLGIQIGDSVIEGVLIRIIEEIINVESKYRPLPGTDKKRLVVKTVEGMLGKREKAAIMKKYGSLETAVQAAYERSSVLAKRDMKVKIGGG